MLKFLCKIFGHHFSQIDMVMAKIKANEYNRGKVPNKIKCRWCKKVFDLNHPESIEELSKKPTYLNGKDAVSKTENAGSIPAVGTKYKMGSC